MDPKTPNIGNTGATQDATGQSLSPQKINQGVKQGTNIGNVEDAATLSGTPNQGIQTGGYGRSKVD
jgi:hypothetical protein